MDKINLQNKTYTKNGTIEPYWFENETIGLKRTLFYRINIPLHSFNSGLEYEKQPVETEIIIEWLQLNVGNTDKLDNLQISSEKYKGLECSVYVGCAHNVCEVLKLNFGERKGNNYEVKGEIKIDFESEGVAENEIFSFQTIITSE